MKKMSLLTPQMKVETVLSPASDILPQHVFPFTVVAAPSRLVQPQFMMLATFILLPKLDA